MIGKVRLASPGVLVVLVAAWLVALVGIDYVYNPHLWRKEAAPAAPTDTALSLWINHLCCTGCLADASEALYAIPWLKGCPLRQREALPTMEAAEGRPRQSEYGGWIDLAVPEITHIDFVEIDRALRSEGLVVSRMVVRGLPHIRFVAEVKHLCCGMCRDAIEEIGKSAGGVGPGALLGPGLARVAWVDSIVADRTQKKIIVYAKFQDADKGVDVAELLGALDSVGLAPFALRVEVENPAVAEGRGRAELAELFR